MEADRLAQGEGQTKRVAERLSQGKRLAAPLEGLLRVAKVPQDAGQEAEATGAGIMTVAQAMGPVLLRVVESNALLQMGAGGAKLSQPEQRFPQHPMGGDQQRRIVLAVRQGKELFTHVASLR